MTNAQKIALRLSEVRQRLNEVSGLEGDTFTDEVRSEAEGLQVEYRDLETRHRAAIVAEGQPEIRPAVQDAEHRERVEVAVAGPARQLPDERPAGPGRDGCRGRAAGGGGHSGRYPARAVGHLPPDGTSRRRPHGRPRHPRASTSTASGLLSLPTASRPGWALKCPVSSPAPTPPRQSRPRSRRPPRPRAA